MDEAAESSIIEGAATTRKKAVELLRSGRKPQSHAEKMVANNYAAMLLIKERLNEPLTLGMMLDLQGVLTEGTLEDPGESRRLRLATEDVRIEKDATGEIVFRPPNAIGLESRLQKLCDFANSDHTGERFVHPIIKACILHFMIGYEHPFCDGNGRTARALFYWFALRHGYSIFEFIPISERIRAGSARYYQAFVDTEQDEGDLTYFIAYKLDIIEQALDRLSQHLKHEEEKLREAEAILRLSPDLSLRQRILLGHALRNPDTLYTVLSHSNSNNITKVTARNDLEDLVRRKLMTTSKRGKEVIYHPAPTLRAKLDRKSR
jgi:Fic family protein